MHNIFIKFTRKKLGDEEVSKSFRKALEYNLENAQSIAASKVYVCKKDEDENGWLTITFEDARAATHTSGGNCDIFSPCDPYIKLFINNENVYESEVFWEQEYVYFGKTYTSNMINKGASIKIEMWDWDRASTSDLILSWDTSIKDLLKNSIKYGTGENKIVTSSSWRTA